MKSVITIVLDSLFYNSQQLKRQNDQKMAQRTKDNVRLCCAFLLNILRSAPPKDFLADRTDRHLLKDVQASDLHDFLWFVKRFLWNIDKYIFHFQLHFDRVQ